MANYPMWHLRFTKARNLLAEACEEAEQAVYEDRHNPQFEALHKRASKLLTAFSNQQSRNYKRGRKEGWLK